MIEKFETSARVRYVFTEAEFRDALDIGTEEHVTLVRPDKTNGTVTVFTRKEKEEL